MSKWWYLFIISSGLYWIAAVMDVNSTWAALRSNTAHHRESNLRYMTNDGKGIDTKRFFIHKMIVWGLVCAALIVMDRTIYGGHPYVLPYAAPMIGTLAFIPGTIWHFNAARNNYAMARS